MESIGSLLGSEVFWAAALVLLTLIGGAWKLAQWMIARIERSIEDATRPIREENERLRHEINTRLHMPSFALNNIEAIERAAELRIQEIERQKKEAIEANQQEHVRALSERSREIESLRQRLDSAEGDRNKLASELEQAIAPERPYYTGEGVGLRTGYILVVRHRGTYGAVKAIDQARAERGGFIRYAWWYQPDGSGSFINANAQTGYGETHDYVPGVPETLPPPPEGRTELEIGPIKLFWSMATDGYGYVYFGPQSSGKREEYELAVTNEVDISQVDATRLEFFRYRPAGSSH